MKHIDAYSERDFWIDIDLVDVRTFPPAAADNSFVALFISVFVLILQLSDTY